MVTSKQSTCGTHVQALSASSSSCTMLHHKGSFLGPACTWKFAVSQDMNGELLQNCLVLSGAKHVPCWTLLGHVAHTSMIMSHQNA